MGNLCAMRTAQCCRIIHKYTVVYIENFPPKITKTTLEVSEKNTVYHVVSSIENSMGLRSTFATLFHPTNVLIFLKTVSPKIRRQPHPPF